jgi:nucleoside-diphosphate kinase
MIEKSLVLLKPDAVQRGLIGEIITRFEKCGLKIIATKMVYADKELAGKHYAEDIEWLKSVGTKAKTSYEKRGIEVTESEEQIGRNIRNQLMDYLSMSPVVALVIEGHNAIAHIRKLVGATAPANSQPGTIRGDYSFDSYSLADDSKRPIQNLIHASDSVENAKKEINLWFNEEEIHVWRRIDEDLLYRKN